MSLLKLLFCFWLVSLNNVALATYTKVSNSGKALPDSATLGSGPNDWACTYDSTTKLIWEVKTNDRGLRDQNWRYTWYDSNSPDGNKGTASVTSNCKTIGRCDTEKFTQDVNTQGLCGAKDWRMPAIEELRALVYCSSGQGNPTAVDNQGCQGTFERPTINSQYFPNTQSTWFWSASVYAGNPSLAWYVNSFPFGNSNLNFKNYENAVRLVRGGQSFDPLVATANAAPTASFTATPTSGSAALTVNLDASVSNDPDGTIATYAWTSSEATAIANGKVSSVIFNQAGTFNITLTVTDNQGATATATKQVTVQAKPIINQAPTASFTVNTTSGTAPLTVNINASASTDPDGRVVTYAWSTSEGKSSNDSVTSFTFNQTGTFTITLTVTDDKGATGKASKTITVSQSAVAPTPSPQPTPTPSSTTGNGYIEGWVYDACSKKPMKDVDVDFGLKSQGTDSDGHYRRQLPFGSYTVKVSPDRYLSDNKNITIDRDNNPNGFVTFTLSPPGGCAALKQSATSFKAIIVAGSGPYIPNGYNHVWNPTQNLADRAYKALRLQGYDKDRILYLSADASPKDVDGDGSNDINNLATLENLQNAISQWAGDVQDVVVYMIGHGGIRSFQLGKDVTLSSQQLKSALDSLQQKIPGVVNVILDSCYSGSFIEPLAAPKRYVITSTREDRNAIISNDGSNSFSFYFWDQVGLEYGSLSQAFTRARQAMSSQLVGDKQVQDAQLDADGSGAFAANDKDIISNYCFGTCQNGHLAIAPVIEGVAPSEDLGGKLISTLRISANKPVVNAWVNIQRPDFHYPKTIVAQANNLQIKLNCSGTRCQGEYQNFNVNDDYVLTYYVQDAEGSLSQPLTLKVNQNGIASSNKKKTAAAVYEESTGILTLKDVIAGGQHYYVELKDQGGYKFVVQNFYQLTEAATGTPANFDGSKVTIPSVFAFGSYYAINLVQNGATFGLAK